MSNLVGVLAVLELLLALAAVASMWLIGHAGSVFAWAGPMFSGTPLAYFGPMALTSVVAILPAALLMGMAFPVGISLWVSSAGAEHAGARIGSIYAVNVAGAVAGSLLAGFVLLPILGSRASLLLTSALGLATGLLLLTQLPRRLTGLALGVGAASGVQFSPADRFPIQSSSYCTHGFQGKFQCGGRRTDMQPSRSFSGARRSRRPFTGSTSTARTRPATRRRWWGTTG